MDSIHSADMDGVEGSGGTIAPGSSFTSELWLHHTEYPISLSCKSHCRPY